MNVGGGGGDELCLFMIFLWTTNYVPWHMLAACIQPFCSVTFSLRSVQNCFPCQVARAVFSDASFLVSLFRVNEDLCPSHNACSFCAVVQCPPHPGLASKAPGFLFVWSTHACFEVDSIPPLRYVVCVQPLFLMFSWGWVVADGMLQKFV